MSVAHPYMEVDNELGLAAARAWADVAPVQSAAARACASLGGVLYFSALEHTKRVLGYHDPLSGDDGKVANA